MFKIKPFGLENTQTRLRRILCIDWDAFSFIYEVCAALKLSGNRDAMLSISCAVMWARNILGYS